jgi:N-acetylmuramoyl-L-alanine amidase
MKISREIADLLNTKEGYSATLTRTDDRFIPLRQRTAIARQHNADLLVSVHADAFNNPKANGASVYALSKNGATSETAKWLAERENKADLIGGLGGVNLDDKDQVLAGVLLDLSMTASMNASVDVGARILDAMGRVNRLHKRRVEKAGFVVLKSPDIPSILVETGFISNPAEAQKLNETDHQRKLAAAVSDGVVAYFNTTPPPGTIVAARKNAASAALTYKASRGDTLSDIASRNNISVVDLMRANGLTRETLYVGQVLVIPTS